MNILNTVIWWERQSAPRNPASASLDNLSLRELADLPTWHEDAESETSNTAN